MTWLQTVVLAIVQGLTEFLPVSSSAHLILASEITGWPDQGLAFDTAAHAGTLTAVMVYFRRDLAAMLSPDPTARRLLAWLAAASIPVLAIGFVSADWIESHLRDPRILAATSIVFALALAAADRLGRRRDGLEGLGWRGALMIGLAQVLALVPGTSRSGITLTAGLALGLTREAAARFAFLLAIPALAAAGGWGLLKAVRSPAGELAPQLGRMGVGAIISGLVAWATIAAFMAWVRRAGMMPFVVYRVLLGIVLLVVFSPGAQ